MEEDVLQLAPPVANLNGLYFLNAGVTIYLNIAITVCEVHTSFINHTKMTRQMLNTLVRSY